MYHTLEEMILATAEAVRPPERLSVSEAAERYCVLKVPGGYNGPWLNETTPYMVEPMDEAASLDYQSLVFVGPSQAAKTEALVLNWIAYTAMCDPADMMVIQTSQGTARDFSKRRLARLFRNSPAVGAKVQPGRHNMNVYDTKFIAGWLLTLSWPTINELSGKPIPRLVLTDYDRMPENIDDEGSPFDLARARAKSFGRRGMVVVESSPGFEIENSRWSPSTAHEAPPAKGILALYNRGDRRRWYWRCPQCREAFEPDFKLLNYPISGDKLEAAEATVLVCPRDGFPISHGMKYDLNLEGRWVKDGMQLRPDGKIVGAAYRSDIASFWLKGVAAALSDWRSIVFNYLNAIEEYEKTGSQEALKTTINTDQGLPFLSQGNDGTRLPEDLKDRGEGYELGVVPAGVRFLLAAVDVQKNRFVVQVHGFGVAGDVWVIDRFDVRKSERRDEDGERYWVSPGGYPEDWRLLVAAVCEKTYPLEDDSGRHMQIKATVCDSGGREGVTANAYTFWRWLRDDHPGTLHRRVHLLKGTPLKAAPRVQVAFPDSERKDRRAAARGEVPVMLINTNAVKDQVNKMLDRDDPHGGLVSFASDLPDTFYTELTVEIRTAKGWENPKNHRNESWDLLCYAVALSISQYVRIEQIDWDRPPKWATEWEKNDLVFDPESNKRFEVHAKSVIGMADLAAKLA